MRLTWRDQQEIFRLFKEDVGLGPNEVQKTQDVTSIGGQNPMPTKYPGQGMNPEEEETPNTEIIRLLDDLYYFLKTCEDPNSGDVTLEEMVRRVGNMLKKLKSASEDEQSVYSNPPNGENGDRLTPFIRQN